MKILAVLVPFLTITSAGYPEAETLIYSQIDQILNHENHTDPALIPCLEVANDFVLGGIFVNERKELGNAIIPPPSGVTNWTVEELNNAAMHIINNMRAVGKPKDDNIFISQPNGLTLEELDNALERYPLPTKVDRSDEFINLHILETLHTIMSEAIEGKFNMRKDTVKLLVPAVDISMWALNDLKETIEKDTTVPQLTRYLIQALNEPMQSLDNGKTFCVVTPVGLIPQPDPLYYIPKATRELIRMSKNKPQTLTRRYNKGFFGIPTAQTQ